MPSKNETLKSENIVKRLINFENICYLVTFKIGKIKPTSPFVNVITDVAVNDEMAKKQAKKYHLKDSHCGIELSILINIQCYMPYFFTDDF